MNELPSVQPGPLPRTARTALAAFAALYLLGYLACSRGATGDGFYTYLMVQSAVSDLDLDLHNQFAAAGNPWGYLPDPDTGYLRMRYELWPFASWAPLMLLGRLLETLCESIGAPMSGARIVETVTLLAAPLSALLGMLGLARLLSRHVDRGLAWLVAAASICATHLIFYAWAAPAYAHPLSFALAAWLIERCDAFTRTERGLSLAQSAALGALLGALMNCRPQCAPFGLLALWPLALGYQRQRLRRGLWLAARGALLVGVAALCFAPTLALFARVYGSPFETFQGPNFMRWSSPWLGAVWFSAAGGLFTHAPLLWLGVPGLFALLREQQLRLPALLLLLVFLIHSYINACAWDYWGGASFGARRATELVAVLAPGQAVVAAWALRWFQSRPRTAFVSLAGAALALHISLYVSATNAVFAGTLPFEGGVPFPERVAAVAREWARLVDRRLGDPLSWPANLLFAWQHGVAARQYSCVVGRVFMAPSAADGRFRGPERIEVGSSRDACLIAEGFGLPQSVGAAGGTRALLGRHGRILLPVHTPANTGLAVTYTGQAACKALVLLDGQVVGSFAALPGVSGTAQMRLSRQLLRSDVQELELVTSAASCLRIATLTFTPEP
jgi:hypothetical protein